MVFVVLFVASDAFGMHGMRTEDLAECKMHKAEKSKNSFHATARNCNAACGLIAVRLKPSSNQFNC